MKRKKWLSILTSLFLLAGPIGCGIEEPNDSKVQYSTNQGSSRTQDSTNTRELNRLNKEPIRHTDQGVPFRDSENSDIDTYQSHYKSYNIQSQGLNNHRSAKIAAKGKTPKNVIVMVGDGMGVGHMEIARLFEHGKDGRLFMQSLPHVALTQTYSANNIVTDSAAAGTALATGVKTNNESIGVNSEGKEVDSILDLMQQAGKKVGIVSTNTATDATPAAFSASVANRWSGQEDVARQILSNDIDVVLGGGSSYFSPAKQDGVNLVDKFKENGYTFVSNRDELAQASGDKLLGLFHPSYMNYKLDRDDVNSKEPTLTEMTKKTIEFLSKGDQGFFAMIEGARIDHAAHAADLASIWKETVEFDQAVEYAVNWAKQDGNTLVVVLADHETLDIAASEPMDMEALKNINVSAEFMAGKLVLNEETNTYDNQSVKDVFKTYANIDLTDAEVAQFNERAKDNEGKVYAAYRVAWEIGSIIAMHNNVAVMDTSVRSLSSTGGHTGNMVPVFAYGVSAEAFDGVLDNTDIPKMIAKIAGLDMNQISVYIDDKKVKFPVAPIIQTGRTIVPIREISEALGSEVAWDQPTQTVTITKGDTVIKLVIGKNAATKNGKNIQLDAPAQILNSKTFIPLRFVSEAFGGEVKWDNATRTITISTQAAAGQPAS